MCGRSDAGCGNSRGRRPPAEDVTGTRWVRAHGTPTKNASVGSSPPTIVPTRLSSGRHAWVRMVNSTSAHAVCDDRHGSTRWKTGYSTLAMADYGPPQGQARADGGVCGCSLLPPAPGGWIANGSHQRCIAAIAQAVGTGGPSRDAPGTWSAPSADCADCWLPAPALFLSPLLSRLSALYAHVHVARYYTLPLFLATLLAPPLAPSRPVCRPDDPAK